VADELATTDADESDACNDERDVDAEALTALDKDGSAAEMSVPVVRERARRALAGEPLFERGEPDETGRVASREDLRW